ncbi:MAG: alpha/beta hydrolase, partial [Clostridiales bacterium]|nr:alpha/beta hydrolase [Clostridiales bacterium]
KNACELEYYPALRKKTDFTVIILPGGGYACLAEHEGKGYAQFFAENGIDSFVLNYHISPFTFPEPLLDSRRAVRLVRANAKKYGINPNKIALMGSSAGGHLCALTSTYTLPVDGDIVDEIDREVSFLPDFQILCYPVILRPETGYAHNGSYLNLIGREDKEKERLLDPSLNVTPSTPPAFIWHTADDQSVNVVNSLMYAKALKDNGVSAETHIFPSGPHGMGLAKGDPLVSQWSGLLLNRIFETF